MQRILAYVVLAVGLSLTLGCQTDLDLESKTWACQTDSDCRGGQVCVGATANEKGICESMTDDASMDAEDVTADSSTTDTSDTATGDADAVDGNDTSDTSNQDTSDDVDATDSGDDDEDGIRNSSDNCPDTPNPGQLNTDGDEEGDACDRTRSLTNASQTAAGTNDSRLGTAVAGGHDLGGDTIVDLLVGAPGVSRAYLVEGNSAGTVTLPTSGPNFLPNEVRSDEFGTNVAIIGAYTSQPTADFLVQAPAAGGGAYVEAYSQNSGVPESISKLVNGTSVTVGDGIAGTTDFDRDGDRDFFVGDPTSNAVFLFPGANRSLLNGDRELSEVTEIAGQTGDELGAAVASLGPLDRGGPDYVAVGAPGNERVYILQYPAGELENGLSRANAQVSLIEVSSGGISGGFGSSLAAIDDVTNDGVTDLAVGQPLEDGGRVLIFDGSALAGAQTFGAADAVITLEAANLGDDFGTSIASIGDVDNDGSIDLLVGAPGVDTDRRSDVGAAYIVPGSVMSSQSSPIASTEFIALYGDGANAAAGQSVAWLRDFNDDGVSDFAVGAPGTGGDDGALYVYFGPIIYGPQN